MKLAIENKYCVPFLLIFLTELFLINCLPNIHILNSLTGVYDFAARYPSLRAAISGGFMFLSDDASAVPRSLALNLAIDSGLICSLPVSDQEALLLNKNHILSSKRVKSLGVLSVNGIELSWSGSRTEYKTDAKLFGNGNAIISHMPNPETGSRRVLDEASRFTPEIAGDGSVDVGMKHLYHATFSEQDRKLGGGLDIFAYDLILRLPERSAGKNIDRLSVKQIDEIAIDSLYGALSVGPDLRTESFPEHPINRDLSLGGRPPFTGRKIAQNVIFQTDDGKIHARLYDGWPKSSEFAGVEPDVVRNMILEEYNVRWGCFLDPGQTAKLAYRDSYGEMRCCGNRHYLTWPKTLDEKYVWRPLSGRPVASIISFK